MVKKIPIWNDNIDSTNYQLSFDSEDKAAPDVVTLTATEQDEKGDQLWKVDLVGKDYVDKGDANLQSQIDEHTERLDTVDETLDNHRKDIETIMETDQRQDVTLTDHELRIVSLEGDMSGVKAVNDIQDKQLEEHEKALESLLGTDGEQNGRIDAAENAIDTINKTISDDVCRLVETTTAYTISDNLLPGFYRTEANARIHLSDGTIEVSPVMGYLAVVVENEVKEIYFNLLKSDISRGNIFSIEVSYFNGQLDMAALVNRETEAKGFLTMDLVDLTTDRIIVGSDRDDVQDEALEKLFSAMDEKVNRSGDTMTGNLDMGNNFISTDSTATEDRHLVTKKFVDANFTPYLVEVDNPLE